MTTNRPYKGHVLISAALLAVMLTLAGCHNPYVEEMLRDMALLSSITVDTQNSLGETAQIAYGLSPRFAARTLGYRVFIPKAAESITVTGIPFNGETVKYRIDYRAKVTGREGEYPDVYVDRTEENETGVFAFSDRDINVCTITLTVDREYRDTTRYTLHVSRIQPPWVTNIEVRTLALDNNQNPVLGSYVWALEDEIRQGFNSSVFEYSSSVNYNAIGFTITPKKRTDNPAAISFEFEGNGIVTQDDAKAEYTFDIVDALEGKQKTITVKVRNPEESVEVLTYRITVIRPEQVVVRDPELEEYFTITGAEGHYFSRETPVGFSVTPPFGYEVPGVRAITETGKTVEWIPTESGGANAYAFYMVEERVYLELTGPWIKIPTPPPAENLNVRYVHDQAPLFGEPEDGLSWATATRDLQGLMDGYNADGQPDTDDDYEIWVSWGTYHPNWNYLVGHATPPAWANAIKTDSTILETPLNWAFVLTEGVKLYGGFKGVEVTRADRDTRPIRGSYADQRTVLSADTPYGKSYRTVIASGISNALMDGFTVKAAFNVVALTPYSINTYNIPNALAGVAYITNASPVFKNCSFSEGYATAAGGLAIAGASCPVFINCDFTATQSAGSGAALGLRDAASRLIMIGGQFYQVWDYGYVIHAATGSATLINVTVKDSLEHAVNSNANGVMVNMTITGNRGASTEGINTVNGTGKMYNCVVKDNFSVSTFDTAATVASGTTIYNTIAPLHANTLPDTTPIKDSGDLQYYPVDPNGNWNTASPAWDPIFNTGVNPLAVTNPEVEELIKQALLKDAAGKSRFNNGLLDLGAVQEVRP